MSKALAATPLDTIERRDLRNAEAVIEKSQQTFLEVGNALAAIRDAKLYRETHRTFEAYCKDRWGFSDSRGRQLIAAAKTAETVTNVTVSNEGTARELGKVPEEQRAEVFEQATVATGGKPTAKAIREAAEEIVEAEPEEEEEAEAEALPPQKAKVLDAKKRPVPADLAPAFEQVGEFKAIARELTALLKRAKSLDEGPAGAWLEWGQMRTHIENAKHVMKFGTPYIVCKYCKGQGCKPCRQSGYLNETPTTRNEEAE